MCVVVENEQLFRYSVEFFWYVAKRFSFFFSGRKHYGIK